MPAEIDQVLGLEAYGRNNPKTDRSAWKCISEDGLPPLMQVVRIVASGELRIAMLMQEDEKEGGGFFFHDLWMMDEAYAPVTHWQAFTAEEVEIARDNMLLPEIVLGLNIKPKIVEDSDKSVEDIKIAESEYWDEWLSMRTATNDWVRAHMTMMEESEADTYEWVRIKDRTPSKDQENKMFVVHYLGEFRPATWQKDPGRGDWFFLGFDCEDDTEITHWRPTAADWRSPAEMVEEKIGKVSRAATQPETAIPAS